MRNWKATTEVEQGKQQSVEGLSESFLSTHGVSHFRMNTDGWGIHAVGVTSCNPDFVSPAPAAVVCVVSRSVKVSQSAMIVLKRGGKAISFKISH